jgi:hypothetical protein
VLADEDGRVIAFKVYAALEKSWISLAAKRACGG